MLERHTGAHRSTREHEGSRIRLQPVVDSRCPEQDPAVLERLQSLAKNETFQAKVQQMAQDPNFMDAAGQYAEEMKEEVIADAKAARSAGDDPLDALENDDEFEEEEEEP